MTEQIKLKAKQLAVLKSILAQKQQLQEIAKELANKEMLVLELLFEEHEIEGEVREVKLNEDKLEFSIVEKEEVKSKPKRVKKVMEVTK